MKTNWRFSIRPSGIICLAAAVLFWPIDRLLTAAVLMAIHEGGHLLAMLLCRVKNCTVEWTPFGFVADAAGYGALPSVKQLMISLSGPLASGIVGIVCWSLAGTHPAAAQAFALNTAILIINAMPVLPLDGGRALLAACAMLGFRNTPRKILLTASCLLAAGLTVLGLYGITQGVLNPTLLALGPYLAYAARQYAYTGGVESVCLLEGRTRRKPGLYRAETWVSVGHPDRVSLLKAAKGCPQKKYLMVYAVDPASGAVLDELSEKQMIVKLIENN